MARLDGYVRVSKVDGRDETPESFISVPEQKRKISAWSDFRGHQIIKWWDERDQSGAKTDRPKLTRALARVESGETEGIVVATLDRFSRSLLGALELLKRIDDAGGVFAAVDGDVDLTTDTGRAFVHILFAFAELEWRRRRAYLADSRRRATDRGIPISWQHVLGYVQGEDRRYQPDPATAPIVVEMFERHARGESHTAIREWLTSSKVPPPSTGKGVWINDTIRQMLRSRTYLGELRHGEFINRHAHPPLISPQLFEAAQRAKPRRYAAGDVALLRGLVHCRGCRCSMGYYPLERPIYRCTRINKSGDCPDPAVIQAEPLHEFVCQQAFARLPANIAEYVPTVAADELRTLEQAVREAEAELAAYQDATSVMQVGRPALSARL